MFHSPDGTLRYSPRDLIAYLERDFAAWCRSVEEMKLVNLLCRLAQHSEQRPTVGTSG